MPRHDVFVKNEKGIERVGAMDLDVAAKTSEMAEQWVFNDYSREPPVLKASDGAFGAGSTIWRVVEAVPVDGKMREFFGYLKARKKAAVAKDSNMRIALLPACPPGFKLASEDSISLAMFCIEEVSADDGPAPKRARRGSARPCYDVAALSLACPVFSMQAKKRDESAMVFRDSDADGAGAVFYQDARRRYEFKCGSLGLGLLVALDVRTKAILDLNTAELALLDPAERKKLLAEGAKIYGEKPSLRKGGGHNVTWSDDEYAHVGLRATYLRLKSLQRYTETYNLCQRACDLDAGFADILARPTLRMASLGGGPAFELDAIREFVYQRHPDSEFDLYSIDLQPAWRPYAEALGCAFVAPFDVSKETAESLLKASGGKPVDLLVISYLMIYCTDDRTADMFAASLQKGYARAILFSERTHKQDIVELLERRGLSCVPLLPQAKGVDQRQMLVTLASQHRKPSGPRTPEPDLVFPNVPFAKGT
ncbi:hypothetical protein M885DRAFT_477923 [Pelagophyceae sp. CCMP2097]|nr:hypothetical protein M885DRAFT_477923 [Pelagophyceae sp. CCMP2097]|mmetsp:Transcript_3972/g.13869  ORF Transcript_3972/g.13869 Transcript_3972/m.13869 type:complete len:481 (+) Transcript_3972:58-1500(+)